MLQNPKVAFRSAELKECTVEKNNLGQPKPRSGNFATVYKGFNPQNEPVAIRVFNRAAKERRERYQKVDEYLKGRNLSCLVNFTYEEKGIRAPDGKMYPLVTMEWVPGISLFEWARDRAREGYSEAFSIAADVWLQMVRELAEHQIVHGDLQHGNILISQDGQFKLVDYDCMAVPELLGNRNLEMGMVPYQHPARNAETPLFAGLDNFSALVIFVALRALAAQPALWFTYVEQPEYDKMLFRKEDFDNPNESALYRDLLNSPDKQVRDLSHYLFQLASYDITQIPPVDEVLLWCHSIEDLLHAKEWDKAVQLHQRMGAGEQISPELEPLVAEAYRRVACREALENALASGNNAEIERCYVPTLLDDYPAAAPLVERARMAGQARQILTTLDAARKVQNWNVFVQTYRKNQQVINHLPAAQQYKQEMTLLLQASKVKKLLTAKPVDDHAVLEAWGVLESQGGHPFGNSLRPHVERCIARENIRELIREAPETPNVTYDKELAAKLKGGLIGKSPSDASLRQTCEEADKRLRLLDKILASSKLTTLESEKTIYKFARELPKGYYASLPHRLKQAESRLKAYKKLRDSFGDEGESASDLKIMEAYRDLERVNAKEMVTDDWQWRIQLASARAPLVRALQTIDKNLRVDELDHRILTIWKAELLDSCEDAMPWKEKYEAALTRKELLPKLATAIEEGDEKSLRELSAAPILKGYPLPPELDSGIQESLKRASKEREKHLHDLLQALIDNQRAVFVEAFEEKMVREIAQTHTYHQATITRWVESDLLPPAKCGLEPHDEQTVEFVEPLRVKLRWNWPQEQISKRCQLKIVTTLPAQHAIPADVTDLLYGCNIDAARYEADGGFHEVELDEDWIDAYVVVWAIVDLGYEEFTSPWVELGRLKPPKKKRWGIF